MEMNEMLNETIYVISAGIKGQEEGEADIALTKEEIPAVKEALRKKGYTEFEFHETNRGSLLQQMAGF